MQKRTTGEEKLKRKMLQAKSPGRRATDFVSTDLKVNPPASFALPQYQTKTFPLVLSTEMHREIALAAQQEGKSIKEFILTAVYEKMRRNR